MPAQEVSLAKLAVGQKVRVLAVNEPGNLGERLLELGLTPGTELTITRRGFRGDPLQLSVRGYQLSLRQAQAQNVIVESVG